LRHSVLHQLTHLCHNKRTHSSELAFIERGINFFELCKCLRTESARVIFCWCCFIVFHFFFQPLYLRIFGTVSGLCIILFQDTDFCNCSYGVGSAKLRGQRCTICTFIKCCHSGLQMFQLNFFHRCYVVYSKLIFVMLLVCGRLFVRRLLCGRLFVRRLLCGRLYFLELLLLLVRLLLFS